MYLSAIMCLSVHACVICLLPVSTSLYLFVQMHVACVHGLPLVFSIPRMPHDAHNIT